MQQDLLLDSGEYLFLVFENFFLICQDFRKSRLILLNGSLVAEDALLVFLDCRLVMDNFFLVIEDILF